MQPTADGITISITVFDRRAYIRQAIQSALKQTVPVRVVVVEDCGPDAGLRDMVTQTFGNAVTYHRNPVRRGLFDNWNACLELCQTPWLSILHDDDFLEPRWAEEIIALGRTLPNKSLYFCNCRLVSVDGKTRAGPETKESTEMVEPDLKEAALFNPVWFPGQLLNCVDAKTLGGFRSASRYCGDWEMWFKLLVKGGGAKSPSILANVRDHSEAGRGTTGVVRTGKKLCCEQTQRKRNVALLKQSGIPGGFDRRAILRRSPLGVSYLLENASNFGDRWLDYNTKSLVLSGSPHWRHFVFKLLATGLGSPFVRVCALLWIAAHSRKKASTANQGRPGRKGDFQG